MPRSDAKVKTRPYTGKPTFFDQIGTSLITHDVDEAMLLSDRIVMMTNGPAATVGEILTVDLTRPGDRIALADDAHYNHFRHEVLRFLYEKQRKVEDLDQHRDKKQTEQPAQPQKNSA